MGTRGDMWDSGPSPPPVPYRWRQISAWLPLIAAVVTGVCFIGVVLATSVLLGAGNGGAVPLTQSLPGCPASHTVEIDGSSYIGCDVSLDWNASNLFGSTPYLNVSFDGVSFEVYGYVTEECPVVSVSGHEAGGPVHSILIYPTPVNCSFTQPTVVSPDGAFGATWSGGPIVGLLVRTG